MAESAPNFDWSAWLAREDVPVDDKAARLAKFVAARNALPEGCEAVWSELTKLASAGRLADAIVPKLCHLLSPKALAAWFRSTPEEQIRSFLAPLIYLSSTDPTLTPTLSATVRVLDDERLSSVIQHLGTLASMYPKDEPMIGQRVLVWLQKLPEHPERFFQQLAAIRAGGRWLPKGDDRVRAWRQFQERFERFADLCRQMGPFASEQAIADREQAAAEMVVAFAQAMPNDWYPDDKQAGSKRRLLEELVAHAKIPAGKLPDEFAVKSVRYLTTRKWNAPAKPDKPVSPLWWLLPSAIGGGALAVLVLALFGTWLVGMYRSWQLAWADPKPEDEPPPRVLAGERLPSVRPVADGPERNRWLEIAASLGKAASSAEPAKSETLSNPSVPAQPTPGDRFNIPLAPPGMMPGGFGGSSFSPPQSGGVRPRVLGSVPLEFATPFAFGADLLAPAVPVDVTLSPPGTTTAILLRNFPSGDCAIRLHGQRELKASVRSGDPLAADPLGPFQDIEVDEKKGSLEVLARFQNQAEPIRLARFSVEQGLLKYEANDPSARLPDDPRLVRLRNALRHCVLEIQVAGREGPAFLSLAKPPGCRFELDAQGSRVIHDDRQNTLGLPGGLEGGELYLGAGRIVYRGYRSMEFGSSWRDQPATKEWLVTASADLAGLEGLQVSLQATDGRVMLALRPPAVATEEPRPASKPDPTAAADRKQEIEARLAKAQPSIDDWVQLLADSRYSDAKLRSSCMAAEALAEELGLPPGPAVPKMSPSTRTAVLGIASRRGSYRRGTPQAEKNALECLEKMEAYVNWGKTVLIPQARLEVVKLEREIRGLPSPSALSAVTARERYQNWLQSAVAVEVNIYRLIPCEGPGGGRNLRVLVVQPGRDAPPPVHALLGRRPVEVGFVWPPLRPRI